MARRARAAAGPWSLRRILDYERRPRRAEVDRAPRSSRAIPGEIRLVECRLNLRHPLRGVLIVRETGVPADEPQQTRSLIRRHARGD